MASAKYQSMLSRKAIAYNVNNLTDARYFAAWGVSYITFGYNPSQDIEQQITAYTEIKNWCEGIQFLISYDMQDQLHDVQRISKEVELDGVVQSPLIHADYPEGIIFRKMETLPQQIEEENIILTTSQFQISELRSLSQSNQMYVPITQSNLAFLKDHEDIGLLLQGSPEEKVGYKSYDELDTLLEELSI